ncbi:MAG: hypothetical protein Q4B58_04595, partial [Bacteroidales bacterium]|nr:hypothetical protein [Bacteroidales bacterium]
MKKTLSLAGALCACAAVYAGGINTNTNQNAAFLRQMSQEAIIDINGLYMNPAGTAFLSEGSHLMICLQNAKQSRDIETVFPLFKYNRNNPTDMHAFKGDAYAPVVPSFMYSHNFDKWSVNASFALIGGGGKCEFDKGLGSFEALYAGNIYKTVVTNLTTALVPVLMQQGLTQEQAMAKGKEMAMQSYQGYSLNAYMKGRQYYFGFTLGANYKVLDNLALGAQLRATYASCNYNGWVEDIHAYYVNPATQQTVDQKIDQELSLNADQKGWGFTPIFSVDWKINEHWNVAAKYEFKTRIRLENKSEMNDYTKAAA